MTGWIVQNHVISTTSLSLEEESASSFQAYESLWRSRAEKLASVSLILSQHVRCARRVQHGRPGHDSRYGGRIVGQDIREKRMFLVTDPKGRVIASLGGVRRRRR